MTISRRTLLAGAGAAASLPIAGARAQGAWPDHPVRHGKQGAEHSREVGLWWGALLSAWRLHCMPPSDR